MVTDTTQCIVNTMRASWRMGVPGVSDSELKGGSGSCPPRARLFALARDAASDRAVMERRPLRAAVCQCACASCIPLGDELCEGGRAIEGEDDGLAGVGKGEKLVEALVQQCVKVFVVAGCEAV